MLRRALQINDSTAWCLALAVLQGIENDIARMFPRMIPDGPKNCTMFLYALT